ncbi:MAG: tRNA (cytidine(56)-2'-O)-methyltransferase [Candidatus Nezhaarchaeales archaeon]
MQLTTGVRKIIVLRYGHRPVRDKRISTHLALVARAFGAHEAWFDEKDENIEKKINQVNKIFGGSFIVRTGVDIPGTIKELKENNFCIVHLTMYGIPLPQVIEEIRRKNKLLVLVGGPKVPKYFYEVADYNVSITNQPHSEVAAVAVFLDWLYEGREFGFRFEGGKIEIEPSCRGKRVKILR